MTHKKVQNCSEGPLGCHGAGLPPPPLGKSQSISPVQMGYGKLSGGQDSTNVHLDERFSPLCPWVQAKASPSPTQLPEPVGAAA